MARKPPRIRRTSTPQFKKDAVALLDVGRSVNEVRTDLGPLYFNYVDPNDPNGPSKNKLDTDYKAQHDQEVVVGIDPRPQAGHHTVDPDVSAFDQAFTRPPRRNAGTGEHATSAKRPVHTGGV